MANIEDIEGQKSNDSISDFSIPTELENLDECTENAEKISLEDVRETNPDIADYVDRMSERLGNSCPDGIMKSFEYYRETDGSIIIKNSNSDFQNSNMVVKGNDVYCDGGCNESDQHPNEFINETELMPNKTYHVDGHFNYITDQEGRVVKTNESLNGVQELDRSGERGNLKPIADAKDGTPDDIGGHIVANNVYGPTEAINIFPQNSELNNSGEWKQMENTIQNATNNGDRVEVTKTFEYSDDSKRPNSIDVSVNVNGATSDYHFENITPNKDSIQSNLEDNEVHEDIVESSKDISPLEETYIKEVVDYPEILVDRIDELSSSIPPKAIDSSSTISDIIESAKKDINPVYLEAPSDSIQIGQISDVLKDTEGLDFNDWQNLSYEDRCESLQNAEAKIAEIEHRPLCEIKYESLGDGNYGYFNPSDKTITINSDYITSNSSNDFKETLDTLVHEGRHAYQNYNLTEREVHPRSGEITNWRYNENEVGYQDCQTCGFESYALQPVESDARAFAEDVLKNYFKV